MYDQANELRNLVRHSAAVATATPTAMPRGGGRPRMIVVAGGKGGVGTTSVALLLAAALGQRRLRTVLVDAARAGDAATLCGIEPRHSLAEVLAGRCTLSEAIQSGPGDLRILPGAWGCDVPAGAGPDGMERLLAPLAAMGSSVEMVVFDLGNNPTRLAGQCWQAADRRLAVTTPETAAILETYASIKRFSHPSATGPIHLLVNMVTDRHAADAACDRLTRACRRFFAVELNFAGYVKKRKKGLNLNPVPADMKGELSVVDVLLNYADYVKFNGDRGTQWHEPTLASSAPWHS